MKYKCENCGRVEFSSDGPPKCYCGFKGKSHEGFLTLMKPVLSIEESGDNMNEYLAE